MWSDWEELDPHLRGVEITGANAGLHRATWHSSDGPLPDTLDADPTGDEFPTSDYGIILPPGLLHPSSGYYSARWSNPLESWLGRYSPTVAQFMVPDFFLGLAEPPPIDQGRWPDGALGYEWEVPVGEWLGTSVNVEVQGFLNANVSDFIDDPVWGPPAITTPETSVMLKVAELDLGDRSKKPTRSDLLRRDSPPDPVPPGWRSSNWGEAQDVLRWPMNNAYVDPPWLDPDAPYNPNLNAWVSTEVMLPEQPEDPEEPRNPQVVSVVVVPKWVLTLDYVEAVSAYNARFFVSRMFQPPRVRWRFPGGLRRLRQRQTLPGADSWPLRQRQNGAHTGSWTTRQRQTGI